MGLTKEEEKEFRKSLSGKMDNLLKLLRKSDVAYWCKWCNRHISREKDGGIFIHDNVYHPTDWIPECGGEHKVQQKEGKAPSLRRQKGKSHDVI